MRFPFHPVLLIFLSVSVLSCRSVVPSVPDPDRRVPKISGEVPKIRKALPIAPEKTRPETPTLIPRVANKTIDGIYFTGVAYDSRTHRLLVIDQNDGPGSRFSSARDVVSKRAGLLAINAGFFTPEGEPLGLVVSGGTESGTWNSASSLGMGIYRVGKGGESSISRRGKQTSVAGSAELLQAGPLLVENGSRVEGLSTRKLAVRSIVLTDGGYRWWVGKTSSCELASLATALAKSSPADWRTSTALNLDGGRSSDLFISGTIRGGPLEQRSLFNRPVRNFLLLKGQ